MRIALISFVSLFCLSALAQSNSEEPIKANPLPKEDEGRKIVSQAYTPDAGHFLLGMDLSGSFLTQDIKSNNVKVSEIETSGGAFNLGIIGGITDNLFAGLSLGSLSSTAETKPVSGATTKEKSSGGRPPIFTIGYSFNKTSDVPVLAGVYYAPKSGTAKSATTTDDGNSLSPADSIILAGHVILTKGRLESDIGISYRLESKGTIEDATTGSESKVTQASKLGLSYGAQIRTIDTLFVEAGAAFDFYGSSKETDDTGSVTSTDGYAAVTFSGGVKYLVTPQFYIGGRLELIGISEIESKSGTTVVKSEKNAGSNLGFNLGFAF